jgi:DNA-binding LacI/PurR family transcriptional regulator
MQVTDKAGRRSGLGRASMQIWSDLKALLRAGHIAKGEYLPPERQLVRDYGLAQSTVRRALKQLEADGLIVSEPRRGYRVCELPERQVGRLPLALVRGSRGMPEEWDERHKAILSALEGACNCRGNSLLAVGSGSGSGSGSLADALGQLDMAGVSGVVLDPSAAQISTALLVAPPVPMVVVDGWSEDWNVDAVIQDGHHGGLLAARYLAAQGCRRVAWFGPIDASAHSRERFGGAATGLVSAGLELPKEMRVESDASDAETRALELLSRRDRPDGILALWSDLAHAVKRAADKLGLVIGRDFEMVGWTIEELHGTVYRPGFDSGHVPPAVTWSVRDMAEAAVARIAERSASPKMSPVAVRVPTTLHCGVRTAECGMSLRVEGGE